MTIPMDIETTSTEAPVTAFPDALRLRGPRTLVKPKLPGLDRAIDSNDEAVVAPKTRNSPMAVELAQLQTQAAEALRAYVLATLDHVSALVGSVEAPASMTIKNGHLRRKALAVNERLDDFIDSARQIMSGLNDRVKRVSREAPQVTPIATRGHDAQKLSAKLQLLTAREKAVLELLLKGLPNKQIGYELGISITTAKAHIGAILRKLNVSNRARVIAHLANVDSGANASLSRKR